MDSWVRDRVSGNTLARLPQRLGVDVTVKEFEGRLQFARPISSVWDDGSVISDNRLAGHPVDIEVDYETAGGRAGEKTTAGGRVTQAVGQQLALGATLVSAAVVVLLSFTLIEPATTRAAFRP